MGLFSSNRVTRKNIIEALSVFFDVGYKTLGKLAEEKEIACRKAREMILQQHFSNIGELEQFEQLFSGRSREYYEVLQPENTELVLQFGQIFYTHFLGKDKVADLEIDSHNLAIVMFVGMTFTKQMIEVKKFFDEILAKCVFDW